jgi:hypothetical protein
MFIKYECRDDTDEASYKMIDSDFEEFFTPGFPEGSDYFPIIEKIISIYERRELPVVPNIMRSLICFSKRNNCSIAYAISVNKNGPNFIKYEKDIEKLMVLI